MLEWKKLLGRAGGSTRSSLGRARCRTDSVSAAFVQSAEARRLQQLTTEMAGTQRRSRSHARMAFPDVRKNRSDGRQGGRLETDVIARSVVVLKADGIKRSGILPGIGRKHRLLVAAAPPLAAGLSCAVLGLTLEAPDPTGWIDL